MNDPIAVTGTPTPDAGNANPETSAAVPAALAVETTSTTQPEGQKPAEPVAPESYDFKMPEGVELDTAAADEFTAIAKELKLDQATAQKVADVGAKMAQRQAEAHAKLVETWTEQVKTDKDIGGDKLDQSLAVARKALVKFGTPELRDVLNSTGLGNHPAVIRAFYNAGKAISEDVLVTGAPAGPNTDPSKRLFPNMN